LTIVGCLPKLQLRLIDAHLGRLMKKAAIINFKGGVGKSHSLFSWRASYISD
jgi:hypothetical protein